MQRHSLQQFTTQYFEIIWTARGRLLLVAERLERARGALEERRLLAARGYDVTVLDISKDVYGGASQIVSRIRMQCTNQR